MSSFVHVTMTGLCLCFVLTFFIFLSFMAHSCVVGKNCCELLVLPCTVANPVSSCSANVAYKVVLVYAVDEKDLSPEVKILRVSDYG